MSRKSRISIHEAYTGLDHLNGILNLLVNHFNPRGLYRPRQKIRLTFEAEDEFQSTRPIQASTHNASLDRDAVHISIHEAYTGLDPGDAGLLDTEFLFQSTRPIQASTALAISNYMLATNFNPRGLYRPRLDPKDLPKFQLNFNPRGLYRPRRNNSK